MGFLESMFGTSSSQEQKQENTPWAPATQALTDSLGMIEEANDSPWSVYGGQQVSPLTEDQQMALRDQRGWFQDGGKSGINQMQNAAAGNIGSFGQANTAYQNQLAGGPVVNQGASLDAARAYSDNPFMDQMVGAATRDVSRNLYEQQLPGIAAYSAGSGNLGSSRRGMLEGIAQRGAADRVADIGAQMRGGAYQQGLGIAANEASQNAALGAQNQGMNMQAAQGLQNLGNAGMSGIINAQNLQNMNNQGLMGAGTFLQGQQQNMNNQASANHYLGQQMPYNQAAAGASIASPMGSSFGTSTMTGSANQMQGSPFGQMAGLGMQAAGLGMLGMGM